MSKKKRQAYHHKDLKHALIERGIELINEEGLKTFSLRKVAAACGVSHAAPYSHFQNKEHLLSAMQDYVTNEFSKVLENTIAGCGNKPNALEYLGKAYVIFFMDNPHYFSFLFTQSHVQIDLSFSADSHNTYKPFEIYKELGLALLDKSNYPEAGRKDAIIAMWSFVHGLASLVTMKNVHYDEDWRDKITDFMKAFQCTFLGGNLN
ncbi:MAG: TetR/AcrR family transcriptional regulator [Peptococcaceae bacterium]|nr:TetR/AcrR family transcriptional regulator [Peptococcaceae bacterium]